MVFEAELCIKLSFNWLYLCTSEIEVFKVIVAFTILRILRHIPPKLLYNHTVYQYSLTSSSSGYLPLGVEYCEVGNRILHGVRSMQRLVESTAELKMVARTRQHGNNTSNRQQAAGSRSTQQAGGNGQELESNRQTNGSKC